MSPELPPENVYGHTKKLRYILEKLEAFRRQRGGRVRLLDFGCGNGEAVSRYLIGDGVDYTGVDFHEPSLRHARRRLAAEGARFVAAPPEDAEYDVLVCADVIEHLPDPVDVLSRQRRRIAPDGLMIAAVPNGWGPFELESWIGRRTGLTALVDFVVGLFLRVRYRIGGWPDEPELPYNAENTHVQFFTRRSLRDTLAAAGWRLEELRHGAFVGGPISARVLKGQPLMRLNDALADRLPSWAVSTWYFTAVPERGAADRTAR